MKLEKYQNRKQTFLEQCDPISCLKFQWGEGVKGHVKAWVNIFQNKKYPSKYNPMEEKDGTHQT